MRIKKITGKPTPATLAVTASIIAILLSATVAHAGFQWVPPTAKTATPSAEEIIVPPGEAVLTPDVEQMVLPLPGEPVAVATTDGVAALNAAPPTQSLQLPKNYEQAPVTNQPVIKHRNITPLPEPIQQPDNTFVEIQPPPVQQQPVVITTKTLMPNDAPQAAMDATPNSQKISINPYPTGAPARAPAPVIATPSDIASGGGMPEPIAMDMPAPVASDDFAVIEGFGSDMPLALALQQIAPADYAFSFDSSVNPGQTVSWEGGKAWNLVLADMIGPLNLDAAISGKLVHIRPAVMGKQSAAPPRQTIAVADASPLLKRNNIKDPGNPDADLHEEMARDMVTIETASGNETAPINSTEKLSMEAEAVKWSAHAGESLKDVLARWSKQEGLDLTWLAAFDYKIEANVSLEDSFDNAAQALISAVINAQNESTLVITINRKSSPNGRVIIEDRA